MFAFLFSEWAICRPLMSVQSYGVLSRSKPICTWGIIHQTASSLTHTRHYLALACLFAKTPQDRYISRRANFIICCFLIHRNAAAGTNGVKQQIKAVRLHWEALQQHQKGLAGCMVQHEGQAILRSVWRIIKSHNHIRNVPEAQASVGQRPWPASVFM